MQTVGEMRHAAIIEGSLMRIAKALELLVKCLETLKDKERNKDKENERDQDGHAVQIPDKVGCGEAVSRSGIHKGNREVLVAIP